MRTEEKSVKWKTIMKLLKLTNLLEFFGMKWMSTNFLMCKMQRASDEAMLTQVYHEKSWKK